MQGLTQGSIATYHDLLAHFPTKNEYKELKGKWAGDEGGFMGALRRKLGQLFRIKWYRIILDEAHAIKNHTSSSKCCK
jgi:SNF2 family DNA or RNA helicase